MNPAFYADMNLDAFWEDSQYAHEEYESDPPTDELIQSMEEELGYKLPASYIALMKHRNGGVPVNACFPTEEPTSWSEDHIAISGILGIGREKANSLGGEFGSLFMIEDWGYPNIGVVICDCPSAGHDVVMLDYRKCGPEGEPEVIHVDQEADYEITFLAKDFETFVRGLIHEDTYDTSEEDFARALERVAQGAFSPLLQELCEKASELEGMEAKIRSICTRITNEKGYFALHADELSMLMYDIQFWLYEHKGGSITREQYLADYPSMIAFGGEFSTGGYAPSFITDWLDLRIKQGVMVVDDQQIRLTDEARQQIIKTLLEH